MKLNGIEVKLANPKKCWTCPLYATWINKPLQQLYKKCENGYYTLTFNPKDYKRPQKCIDENGF